MGYEESNKIEKVSIPMQEYDSLLKSSGDARYYRIQSKKHFIGRLTASYLGGCCATFIFSGRLLLFSDSFSQGILSYFSIMLFGILFGAPIYGVSFLASGALHDYKGSLVVPILVVLFLAPALFFLFLFNPNPY